MKILILTIFFTTMFYFLGCLLNRRKAEDVLDDLIDLEEDQQIAQNITGRINVKLTIIMTILFVIGYLFSWLVAGVIVIFLWLINKIYQNRRAKQKNLQINRILPLTMERLVMAMEAGNDVLTACGIIIDQDKKTFKDTARLSKEKSGYLVSQHLESIVNLVKNGESFADSARLVAKDVKGTALSQTFIHLSLAYAQGGELIGPLRELSNATQLAYQEDVEESIAKLPVKATVPLIIIFAGLILFFITPPLLEVKKMTTEIQEEV